MALTMRLRENLKWLDDRNNPLTSDRPARWLLDTLLLRLCHGEDARFATTASDANPAEHICTLRFQGDAVNFATGCGRTIAEAEDATARAAIALICPALGVSPPAPTPVPPAAAPTPVPPPAAPTPVPPTSRRQSVAKEIAPAMERLSGFSTWLTKMLHHMVAAKRAAEEKAARERAAAEKAAVEREAQRAAAPAAPAPATWVSPRKAKEKEFNLFKTGNSAKTIARCDDANVQTLTAVSMLNQNGKRNRSATSSCSPSSSSSVSPPPARPRATPAPAASSSSDPPAPAPPTPAPAPAALPPSPPSSSSSPQGVDDDDEDGVEQAAHLGTAKEIIGRAVWMERGTPITYLLIVFNEEHAKTDWFRASYFDDTERLRTMRDKFLAETEQYENGTGFAQARAKRNTTSGKICVRWLVTRTLSPKETRRLVYEAVPEELFVNVENVRKLPLEDYPT